jgi:hypothetical protein
VGKTAKKGSNLSTNLSEKLERNSAQFKAQKSLNFTPDATHQIAINFIKKNPQFESSPDEKACRSGNLISYRSVSARRSRQRWRAGAGR